MSRPHVASQIVRRRRTIEAGLLLLASMVTVSGYVLASLGANSSIPAQLGAFVAILIGLAVLAHIAVRWFARGADATLLPLAFLLNGIGYVMITRLDSELAILQTIWTIVAIVGFISVLVVVERAIDLARYKWTLLAVGSILLLLPLVPGLGWSNFGARIWVRVGPVTFQPGEFAKIALAIFFAAYLADRRELITTSGYRFGPIRIPEFQYLAPILVAWLFAVLVMVGERDLGSSLLFFALFVIMMWIATEQNTYLIVGLILFGSAAYASWYMFGHVQTRVANWLNPWADEYGRGYQTVQALYGLGDGGITGTGLGRGSPDKVPAATTDFIFAAVGEEMGLLGASAVLMAYLLMIGAGLRIALRTERAFEKLLAAGLTAIIGVQSFIIIGGVVKLVPMTGITLPFMSYGGSSLLSNYVILALLLRLSDTGARRVGDLPDDLSPRERWAAFTQRTAQRRRRNARAMSQPAINTPRADNPGVYSKVNR